LGKESRPVSAGAVQGAIERQRNHRAIIANGFLSTARKNTAQSDDLATRVILHVYWMNSKEHWDQVYQTEAPDDVSWFQTRPAISLKLIDATGNTRHSAEQRTKV
jgi:hypothetical protein